MISYVSCLLHGTCNTNLWIIEKRCPSADGPFFWSLYFRGSLKKSELLPRNPAFRISPEFPFRNFTNCTITGILPLILLLYCFPARRPQFHCCNLTDTFGCECPTLSALCRQIRTGTLHMKLMASQKFSPFRNFKQFPMPTGSCA
jgi:hypothetical protein